MPEKNSNSNSLSETFEKYIPQISIDCVLFKFLDDELEFAVLTPPFASVQMLPSGFIFRDEAIDTAAKRIIENHIGISNPMIYQFGTFGGVDRMFDVPYLDEQSLIPKTVAQWISQRFITIGYYSAVNDPEIAFKHHPLFGLGKWLNISEVSSMSMDHPYLIKESLRALTRDLLSKPVLENLLPKTFTISTIQKLYEAILDRPIDRGNFRQRMLKSEILSATGQTNKSGKGRPAELFKLNQKKYRASLNDEMKFGF